MPNAVVVLAVVIGELNALVLLSGLRILAKKAGTSGGSFWKERTANYHFFGTRLGTTTHGPWCIKFQGSIESALAIIS